jgi:dolichol-phosphate mannosyltransferase
MDPSKILGVILTYNNGEELCNLMDRIPVDFNYDLLVHVDGSTDGSDAILDDYPYPVIRQDENHGIGYSMRVIFRYAKENGYEAIAIIPGNNKNDPSEVDILVNPILKKEADFVQGSRFLSGSKRDHTPFFRLVMVKFHAGLFSLLTFRKITDALEGFRAFKLSLLEDPSINVEQDWLNTYGLETYLFYKVTFDRKYNYVEVPVSKIYPQNTKHLLNRNGVKYSHIRPFVDWWHILKPIFFLFFKIKK